MTSAEARDRVGELTVSRWWRVLAWAAIGAVCAQSVARTSLWKAAEPRVLAIARDQWSEGLLRSLTFSGMPFLEKPPLYYDLTALAFHAAGGPSIVAARVVVAVLGVVCVAAIALAVSRAAGERAGLLAALLLAVSPGFLALVRRLGVDVALCASLCAAFALLYRSLVDGGERPHRGWFAASLAAAGCAALSKGVFGTFLFLAPTVAYALVAGEGRVIRALLRPGSLALLALPHAAWAAVLYRSGGWTYVFEHFVNNTVGRALHRRFAFGQTLELEYGDVGQDYEWWYYLRRIPPSAVPAVLAMPPALVELWRRGGLRARDTVSRLQVLALCWGVVPPLLLSFSSYKGRGHLAASTAALVVLGATWLAPRIAPRPGAAPSRSGTAATWLLYASVPLAVLATCLGLPSTAEGAIVLWGAGAVAAVVAWLAAWRARDPWVAVNALAAALAFGYVVDMSPGRNVASDAENTMDAASQWVAAEVGAAPLGVYYTVARPRTDPIGWSRENEVATLTWWVGRPVVRLATPEDVAAFLAADEPRWFVAHRDRGSDLEWPRGEGFTGWFAEAGNVDEVFVLVANRAAAERQPGPAHAAPSVGPVEED